MPAVSLDNGIRRPWRLLGRFVRRLLSPDRGRGGYPERVKHRNGRRSHISEDSAGTTDAGDGGGA